MGGKMLVTIRHFMIRAAAGAPASRYAAGDTRHTGSGTMTPAIPATWSAGPSNGRHSSRQHPPCQYNIVSLETHAAQNIQKRTREYAKHQCSQIANPILYRDLQHEDAACHGE